MPAAAHGSKIIYEDGASPTRIHNTLFVSRGRRRDEDKSTQRRTLSVSTSRG